MLHSAHCANKRNSCRKSGLDGEGRTPHRKCACVRTISYQRTCVVLRHASLNTEVPGFPSNPARDIKRHRKSKWVTNNINLDEESSLQTVKSRKHPITVHCFEGVYNRLKRCRTFHAKQLSWRNTRLQQYHITASKTNCRTYHTGEQLQRGQELRECSVSRTSGVSFKSRAICAVQVCFVLLCRHAYSTQQSCSRAYIYSTWSYGTYSTSSSEKSTNITTG